MDESLKVICRYISPIGLHQRSIWGLAFTFSAAILAVGAGTNNPMALKRAAKITVAIAITSSILLVIVALMWSFMVADIAMTWAKPVRYSLLMVEKLFTSMMPQA